MMSLIYIFWMYVLVFAFIGAMRGWVKELLVAFSAITALAVNLLLEKYIPLVKELDQRSAVVLTDDIDNLLAQPVFSGQFRTLLDM